MLDVIAWELSRRRTAIIWWSAGSAIMVAVIVLLYPSIRDQAEQLNSVINQLPEGLRGLKTGAAGSVNVADPIAFLNSQLYYATLPLIWIIFTITRGSSSIGKEEQSRTLELLLAKPLSRTSLLLAKIISLFIESMAVAAVAFLVAAIFTTLVDMNVSIISLALVTLMTMLFSLSFGFIAFSLQAASNITRRMATAVAVFVGFGGYLLASLSGLTDWLKVPAKFAPFHYFNPEAILHGNISLGITIYLIATLIIFSVIGWLGFRRRDIY